VMKVNADGTLAKRREFMPSATHQMVSRWETWIATASWMPSRWAPAGHFVAVTLHGTSTITGVAGGAIAGSQCSGRRWVRTCRIRSIPRPRSGSRSVTATGSRLNVYDVHGRVVTALANGQPSGRTASGAVDGEERSWRAGCVGGVLLSAYDGIGFCGVEAHGAIEVMF
jgi:hypothetical protein